MITHYRVSIKDGSRVGVRFAYSLCSQYLSIRRTIADINKVNCTCCLRKYKAKKI